MPSSVQDYVTVRAQVDAYCRQFQDWAKTLERVAHALHHQPERFAFINLPEPKLPMGAFGVAEVDAMKYPTAVEIQFTLAEFHRAHRAHLDLYAALPPPLRSSVAPPLTREFAQF